MVELNIALKRSELVYNKSASLGKLGHFVITLVVLKITVCKGIEVWGTAMGMYLPYDM